MKKITLIGWYLLGVLTFVVLMFLAFLAGRWTAQRAADGDIDTTDTLIVKDTVKIPFDKIETQVVMQEVVRYKYVPVVVTDTFVERDTVIQVNDDVAVIPISRKTYTDSATYRAVVSGYDPRLDEIEVYRDNMIVTKVSKKRSRWAIGAQAGAGIGLINRKPDIYVGLGVNYNITP